MGTWIQYKAFPGIVQRHMGKDTWKALGIDFDEEVWFTNANQNQVDASDFPPSVIEVFREDGDFKIVETDGDERPRAPKQFTGEEYESAMQRARDYAGLDEDQPSGGSGGSSSTATQSTARSTKTSTSGPSGSGSTTGSGSTKGKTT